MELAPLLEGMSYQNEFMLHKDFYRLRGLRTSHHANGDTM
jgi:hypothetical protein